MKGQENYKHIVVLPEFYEDDKQCRYFKLKTEREREKESARDRWHRQSRGHFETVLFISAGEMLAIAATDDRLIKREKNRTKVIIIKQ